MKYQELEEIAKPLDWPQNQREARLSNILNAIEEFQLKPNYGNKEVLLSLISETDPNQYDALGLNRITDYEIALINTIYFHATIMQLPSLKLYLYKEVTETTRMFNMLSKMGIMSPNMEDINKYSLLIIPLKLYYIAYWNFNYYKNRTFCEEILDAVNLFEISEKEGILSIDDIEYAFVTLMYDISNSLE